MDATVRGEGWDIPNNHSVTDDMICAMSCVAGMQDCLCNPLMTNCYLRHLCWEWHRCPDYRQHSTAQQSTSQHSTAQDETKADESASAGFTKAPFTAQWHSGNMVLGGTSRKTKAISVSLAWTRAFFSWTGRLVCSAQQTFRPRLWLNSNVPTKI